MAVAIGTMLHTGETDSDTFDLFEAEDHRNRGVEYEYEVFVVPEMSQRRQEER
jgi:hypothetical protein